MSHSSWEKTRVPRENPHSVLRSQRESTHLSPSEPARRLVYYFFISLIKNFTTLQPITELRGLHVSLGKHYSTCIINILLMYMSDELMNLQILFKKRA